MKICIIAEGCYPYVVGGVSSWIQMMLKGLSEFEFEIYTIAVSEDQRGNFKYEIPENVVTIHENFFIISSAESRRGKRRKRLPDNQAKVLRKLVMSSDDIAWKEVYETIRRKDFSADDFLGGYDFYDATEARYVRDSVNAPFADYLWTQRSMFTPLLTILGDGIPKADLYHSVSAGYAGVVGAPGSVIYQKPFLLTEHGIYTREREEELIRSKWTKGYFKEMWIRQFYTLSLFAYKQAGAVASLFDKNADIQKELGCPPDKIHIIPNGVDAAEYGEMDWKRPPDGFVNIGAVIRVTPIKDIKSMIMAFNVTRQKVPNARFFILGPYDEDPEYHMECVSMVEQLGLSDVLQMPGRVSIRDHLPKMDIMVLTSISEGQPLAILEGMLFRKPWVSTNVGSCSQLLRGNGGDDVGDAGLVVPVMDVQQIASAVIRLALDERLRVDMGEVGYRRVLKYYRLDDMFDRYREIYLKLGGGEWQE